MKFKSIFLKAFLLILTLHASILIEAQSTNSINKTEKADVIDKLTIKLQEYLYPSVSAKIITTLKDNLANGIYDRIENPINFTRLINQQMLEISNDKHLIIRYDPEDVAEIIRQQELSAKQNPASLIPEQRIKSAQANNHGFKKVEVLPGNIGYLRLDEFEKVEYSSKVLHASLEFLSSVGSLIIDLRRNNGGWSSSVQVLSSYFIPFESGSKNNRLLFIDRIPSKNITNQYWIIPDLPSNRLADIPIYILTSNRTYSAAENFTSILQSRKRAIVIGEITRGGANSTNGPEILHPNFIVKMPVSEHINPITGDNWEGTGLKPNIEVDQEIALETALMKELLSELKNYKTEYSLLTLGYDYLGIKLPEVALLIFKENLKQRPESAYSHIAIAEYFKSIKDYPMALKKYKEALELDPDIEYTKNAISEVQELHKKTKLIENKLFNKR